MIRAPSFPDAPKVEKLGHTFFLYSLCPEFASIQKRRKCLLVSILWEKHKVCKQKEIYRHFLKHTFSVSLPSQIGHRKVVLGRQWKTLARLLCLRVIEFQIRFPFFPLFWQRLLLLLCNAIREKSRWAKKLLTKKRKRLANFGFQSGSRYFKMRISLKSKWMRRRKNPLCAIGCDIFLHHSAKFSSQIWMKQKVGENKRV